MQTIHFVKTFTGTAQAPPLNRSPNQEISLMKTPHTVPTLQQTLKLPHLFIRSL
jgi:hypothetical protein